MNISADRSSAVTLLDELGAPNQQPIGINLMQLTIAPDEAMAQQARLLIELITQRD